MKRQTSIDCFNKIKENGLLSKRRLEVYEAIFKNAPCTTNEALRDINSGSHGVGSRTSELRDLGVIYEKRQRKCSITGMNVIEWDLTDKLPSKLQTKKYKTGAVINNIDEIVDNLRKLYKIQTNVEAKNLIILIHEQLKILKK
jgi:hypothetical protein